MVIKTGKPNRRRSTDLTRKLLKLQAEALAALKDVKTSQALVVWREQYMTGGQR